MPRIDPIQLLKCLSVLLSPNGGIRSNDEVHRLASLMTKFSKKLVSKCIYIQILKCTEAELLGSFMGSGGWRLAHMWLTESIAAKNWPLVRELLELLLLCPVDIDRLKTNNCPKLVKELSKDGSQAAIRALAGKLVEQWLKTVKGEPVMPVSESDFPQIIADAGSLVNSSESAGHDLISESPKVLKNDETIENSVHAESGMALHGGEGTRIKKEETIENCLHGEGEMTRLSTEPNVKEESKEIEALPILRISLKDGKQVISKLDESDDIKKENISSEKEREHKSSKSKIENEDGKSSRSSSKPSGSSKSHSSKSSSSDKHRKSSSSSSKDKSKDSSKHSGSNEKQKDKSSSDKSHQYSRRSKDDKTTKITKSERSHRSDKTKEEKVHKTSKDHRQTSEKDSNDKIKDIVEKIQPIGKLMKIPKVSDALKKEKPSISIESRKPNDPNRPKTVKTFHSKFRSHGLEEEAKPPPPRGSVLKKPLVLPPAVAISKRPSPPHTPEQPPEKKSKLIEHAEKPGSIKLIPAKPKPALLLESDMFMDALNASATNKKEPKKRKRRISGSKDGNPPADASPPTTPTAAPSSASPNREAKSTPLRFYKDTLETEEEKEKEQGTENDEFAIKIEAASDAEKDDEVHDRATDESHVKTNADGLKGVLCYHKKKGPKKSIRWRPDAELEHIQYFELDDTERVNVSKTFSDMKNLERFHEREAVQKARNLLNDVMEARTSWRGLIPVDVGGAIAVDYGKNSKEKELQAARQKSVLQSLYLKTMIPDAPSEPDPETHTHTEPTIIPLDDITGNPDTVSDFRNTPWPEPRGSSSSLSSSSSSVITNNIGITPMFPPISQFPGPFPNVPYGMPPFQGAGPGLLPPDGDWQNNMPPMVPGGMPPGPMVSGPGPMPPALMNPPTMPPGIMMPPDGMMGPNMFGGPGPFPIPPEGFNMMDNMNGPPNIFPPGFPPTMQGGPCTPGPDNGGFSYNNRGGTRGRGGGSSSWRGGWEGPSRGRGSHGQGGWKKAKCIHFLKKGSCRQGDSCAFQHPGVNCPY